MQFTTNENSIKVYFGRQEQTFLLKVSDTGVGMTEEELSRIWDRFYKADPSRGMHSEGTGLGLTIVHQLVKEMNGSIEVKSQINVGTEFTLKFPLVSLDIEEEI
jgi:signal transduction histidine kinase